MKRSQNQKHLYKELIVILKVNGYFELDWQLTKREITNKEMILQEEIYQYYLAETYESVLFLGFLEKSAYMSDSLQFLYRLASSFISSVTSISPEQLMNENAEVKIDTEEIERLIQKCPYLNGVEFINHKWVRNFWKQLNKVFFNKIQQFHWSTDDYFLSLNPSLHLLGRIFFYLEESEDEQQPFSFRVTYSTAGESRQIKEYPLKQAVIENSGNLKRLNELMSPLTEASLHSEFLRQLIQSEKIYEFNSLSSDEAYLFLNELHIYEQSGIICKVPKWWKEKTPSSKLSIHIDFASENTLSLNSILNFKVEMMLGNESISEEQLKSLIGEAQGLQYINGRWIEVNHRDLNETLTAFSQAQKLMTQDLGIIEALKMQLNIKKTLHLPGDFQDIEITNGEFLTNLITTLTNPGKITPVDVGSDFNTKLRLYQEHGLNWLWFMKNLKLGTCLADDMGLGKTVQILALIHYARKVRKEKTLLIIPASIIGNWISELNRFTPDIKYYVIHPSENKNVNDENSEIINAHELFITTYTMVSKVGWLRKQTWDTVILDEAQAIKNPRTKQTRIVKQLNAVHKIALTGTPIENHLSDLWSLFDFLNKGLLGTPKEFNEFIRQIKEKNAGYTKLKNVVNPFILRRLKTDKSIISDLPDKVEMKSYIPLSKKQIALYSNLVNQLKIKLEQYNEGIERKGVVLSSIMKFKQICNHPSQYTGQLHYPEKDSGKFQRLKEICDVIYEKRERVLVFTQFKEITEPLNSFLEGVFGHKGLVFHGGTSVIKRKEIVSKFQGHEYVPYMVISIKAGGVGLNLTAANHVIHFDRWWNPAVENQATDRVFRIGQSKNVIVHKFISSGTIEEKIDRMIEAKVKLSNEVISDQGADWISSLDNEALMELFRLE
ncbi:MAG: DEAD/DEAH box helicase [Clostridia bacterium]|nr:DEAD/DEAH box helicase [Clostridia bacterium]